eukprot:TRINITY_DN17727_c0_g1_i1.p1 TRINITY_DN17727_c0_g1~~TRINITY_DN17727_c0_g1_i1.p1  ORF type:complete len:208 (-),score=46.00 TRINITY_DN17727_c0_g1_i1:71-658(-)
MGAAHGCEQDCVDISARRLDPESGVDVVRTGGDVQAPQLQVPLPPIERSLPDPAFVRHVAVEQHLEVAQRLGDAVSCAEALRQALGRREAELDECRFQRDALQRKVGATAVSRENVEAELARVREELAQLRTASRRLQADLDRTWLEKDMQTQLLLKAQLERDGLKQELERTCASRDQLERGKIEDWLLRGRAVS